MIEMAYFFTGLNEDHRLNDTIAGICNIWVSFGGFFGPIIGSLLTHYFSYENSYSIIGACYFVYSIVYFFLAVVGKNNKHEKCLENPLLSKA